MRPVCVICTDLFVINSHISACTCGHIFHEECLFRWFKASQKSCPQCRAKVKESEVIKRLYLTESESLPSTQSLSISNCNDEGVKQKYEDLLNKYEELKSDFRQKSDVLIEKTKLIEQKELKIKELDDFKSNHKKRLNENVVLIDYLKKELEGLTKTKELYETREQKIFDLEAKLKEYRSIELIYKEHENEFANEMRKCVGSTVNVSHLQTVIRQLVSTNVLLKEHLDKQTEEKKLLRKKVASMEKIQSDKDKFLAKKESEMVELLKKIAKLEQEKLEKSHNQSIDNSKNDDFISSSQPVKSSSTPILSKSVVNDDSDIQYMDDIGRFEKSYLRKKGPNDENNSPITPLPNFSQKRKNPFLKTDLDEESDEITEIPPYQPDAKKRTLSQVLNHVTDSSSSDDILLVKPIEKVAKPNRLFKTTSFSSGQTSKEHNDSIEIKPLKKTASSYIYDGLGGRQKVLKTDNLKSYFTNANSKNAKLSKFKVT